MYSPIARQGDAGMRHGSRAATALFGQRAVVALAAVFGVFCAASGLSAILHQEVLPARGGRVALSKTVVLTDARQRGGQGIKVFSVLSQTSETCNDYPHLRLLQTLHNNLGGHGPDAGREGIRYLAQLVSGGKSEQLILEVHTGSSYSPAIPSANGLSSSQAEGLGGHTVRELCRHNQCANAMYFGSVNIRSGTATNITFSFFDHDLKPRLLPEISLTFFDLDTGSCSSSPFGTSCTAHSVESVTPLGSYVAYLSGNTQVKYDVREKRSVFSASKYGSPEDNPLNSRLLTLEQMDKAVTSVFSGVQEVTVTLAASEGTTARGFFFDFVPSLLCAETVKEWPAWMRVRPGETITSTRTATTTLTTTAGTQGQCLDGHLECEEVACPDGEQDLQCRLARLAGAAGCSLQQGLCWAQSQVTWPKVLAVLGYVGHELLELLRYLAMWLGREICKATQPEPTKDGDTEKLSSWLGGLCGVGVTSSPRGRSRGGRGAAERP